VKQKIEIKHFPCPIIQTADCPMSSQGSLVKHHTQSPPEFLLLEFLKIKIFVVSTELITSDTWV